MDKTPAVEIIVVHLFALPFVLFLFLLGREGQKANDNKLWNFVRSTMAKFLIVKII